MTLHRKTAPMSNTGPVSNPCELQIDLFCRGVRLLDGVKVGRGVRSARAGLGSGLDLILPGKAPLHRPVWVNAPVLESFVSSSPWTLRDTELRNEETGQEWTVGTPPKPAWYDRETSTGRTMATVGILQGTYLGIYIGPPCSYWKGSSGDACRFCTTGRNITGQPVTVEDVVETARAAKAESGVTFVHLNTGYQGGRAAEMVAPFVDALKRDVGVIVGVQIAPEVEHSEYDRLLDLGTDHFSFCYELHDPDFFAAVCPGKENTLGQDAFFNALRYCSARLPKGACSGEIIAGLEPVDASLAAIDFITSIGAFPTVCIFRPLTGSALVSRPPPDPADMRRIMRHMWNRCRDRGIPIGMARNLEVSLVVQPTDAAYLAHRSWRNSVYRARLALMRPIARWKLRHSMSRKNRAAQSTQAPHLHSR